MVRQSALDAWIGRILTAEPHCDLDLTSFVNVLEASRHREQPLSLSPIERAAEGGAMADRLGLAFVAGYHTALERLQAIATENLQHIDGVSLVPFPTRRACFAVTEAGGAHPKAIQSTLAMSAGQRVLRGQKTFVTLAEVSQDMLVVAKLDPSMPSAPSRAAHPDRPSLVVVRVPSDRLGIVSEPRPHTSFAPEIPHATVTFHDVLVDEAEVLPGDGYADYSKPFRTVEDLHVLASTLGHLMSVAKRGTAATALVPRLVSALVVVRALADDSPRSPVVHVALESIFGEARALYEDATSALSHDHARERARLDRDLPLLRVAESARKKRFELALESLVASR